MTGMLRRWKRRAFQALGIDPEPVVVTLWSGPAELCGRMQAEVESLLPEYRHVVVSEGGEAGRCGLRVGQGTPVELALRVKQALRGKRIGMVAALFGAGAEGEALRQAAFLVAPSKVLAYNTRLERLHLRMWDALTAYLFLAGVPLGRAQARPWWWPLPHRRTFAPDEVKVVEGRAASAARRAVAVLTPFQPWPLSHGGAVRMYHLLREAAVEFDIHLFCFLEPGEEATPGPLGHFCRRITYVAKPRYHEPRWSTIAPAETREYRSPAMERELERFRREHPGAPVQVEFTQLAGYRGDILVEHDITFDLYRQIQERARTWASWWDWWRWRRFEGKALRRFERVVAMSAKDAEMAGRACDVIPNGVDLERFAFTPEGGGREVLFVGSLRHFPNAAAFRFLWNEIWPRVRALCPEARLTVVAGPDARSHWRAFTGEERLPEGEGLTLREFVADVAPLYRAANLVVIPTLYSAGTNLKALEAMASGRAIVATPSGVGGLGLVDGESVAIASEAEALARLCVELLGDGARRARLAEAAAERARREFGWRSLGEKQRKLWRAFAPQRLRIRKLSPRDGAAVNTIQAASTRAAQWDLGGYPAETTWVAETEPAGAEGAGTESLVVGFVAARCVAVGENEVLNLAVAPEWRRQGVARRLLDVAFAALPGEWFLEVRESNEEARRLYESLGFQTAGRRARYYRDPDEDALILKRC